MDRGHTEWTQRIKRAEKSGERLRYKWMRQRTAGKAERAPEPWLLVFPREEAKNAKKRGKEKRYETVYSQLARIFFGSGSNGVPPEDALFLIATMRIDNVRLVYTEGPLWQTLVPWTLWYNALWLIVLRSSTEKPLSSCTHFAECTSFRRRAISGAVNRKRTDGRLTFEFFILPEISVHDSADFSH